MNGTGTELVARLEIPAPGRIAVGRGNAFVIGSKAKGEMVGEFPGLATLDEDDNVRVTSDFRAMYCSLLEQWLGHDAAQIIPGAAGFARPVLVKA